MINQLLPNATLPIIWVMFMVVMWVLTKLVFNPTAKIVEARRRATTGSQDETESLIEDTKIALATYEKKIHEARVQAAKIRETLIKEGREQERAIISKARSENEAKLQDIERQLGQERKEAEMKLRQYAQELAQEIVQKVLERNAA